MCVSDLMLNHIHYYFVLIVRLDYFMTNFNFNQMFDNRSPSIITIKSANISDLLKRTVPGLKVSLTHHHGAG